MVLLKNIALQTTTDKVRLQLQGSDIVSILGFSGLQRCSLSTRRAQKWSGRKNRLHLFFTTFRNLEPEDFLKSSRKLLAKNPEYAARGSEESLLRFQKYIAEVEEGDRYTLLYLPQGKLYLYLNGELSAGELKILYLREPT